MTPGASPWDALMPRIRRVKSVAIKDFPTAQTKTQQLLEVIDTLGKATTTRLCLECEDSDLDSRKVWGLLKTHLQCGRVRFVEGKWLPGDTALDPKALRAANVLRALGWTVVPPSGKGA